MIAYLPNIYPDELVYSWFCRYYIHSGSLNHKMALNDLFCKKSDGLSKEFVGNINPEARERIEKVISMEDVVLKHTMFPQYARFSIGKEQILNTLINNATVDVHNLFTVLPRNDNDRYLKYCPICVKEDRGQYGETYWHRIHQIRGMQVCTKHGCVLHSSNVSAISYNSFSFQPTEFNVDGDREVVMVDKEILNYSKHIVKVFDAPMGFDNKTPVCAILHKVLKKQGYLKGSQRKVQQLSEDIRDFYSNFGLNNIASFNQIQRVLHGDLYEFSTVCQIAYFLGLSVDELLSAKLTKEEIAEGTFHRKAKKKEWDAIDKEIAPALERFAIEIYNGIDSDGRPERITLKRVCREFEINEETFKNLHRCQKIIKKYAETQDEFWAREIVWAYKKLKEKGQLFYWSDIRKLTGIKKCNLDRVIPYLKEYPEIVAFLIK